MWKAEGTIKPPIPITSEYIAYIKAIILVIGSYSSDLYLKPVMMLIYVIVNTITV